MTYAVPFSSSHQSLLDHEVRIYIFIDHIYDINSLPVKPVG